MQRVEKRPQLHGHFGALSQEALDYEEKYVYFIRGGREGIKCFDLWEEAEKEMPAYFSVGNISGNLIDTMYLLLTVV